MQKIAIILFRSLGDVVMSTGIVKALKEKYIDSEVTFITEKQNVHILEGNQAISEIVIFNNYFEANIYCSKNKFDKVIRLNMANTMDNAWHHVGLQQNQHLMEWYAKRAGLENFTDYHHYLYLTDKDEAAIAKVWSSITREGKFVAIHTSSGAHAGPQSRVESKDWPIEYFNALADELIAAGHNVVQIGAFSDKKLSNPSVIDATGKLTFKQHVGFFKHFSAYVGNDSGPAYLAGEAGIPCLIIMGSTQNKGLGKGPSVGPCHPNVVYIEPQRPKNATCEPIPCYTHCQIGKAGGCVSDVAPKDVKKIVWEMLGNGLPIGGDRVFKESDIKKIETNSLDIHTEYSLSEFENWTKEAKVNDKPYPKKAEFDFGSPKEKVSGVLVAYNEELVIEKAILSLSKFCDEIILFDSFSTDSTVEIANKYGCKVFQHEFDNHRDQKNRAIESCSNEWIFLIDSDEYLSDDLIDNIKKLVENKDDIDAFAFPRKNYLDGNGPSGYPDFQTRLFKNYVRHYGHPFHHAADGNAKKSVAIQDHGFIIHDKTTDRQKHQNRLYYSLRPQDYKSVPDGAEDVVLTDNHDDINVYRDFLLKKDQKNDDTIKKSSNNAALIDGKFKMIDGELVFETEDVELVSNEKQPFTTKLVEGKFAMRDGKLMFDSEKLVETSVEEAELEEPPQKPKLSAFTIVKNAVKYDYPIVESINSVLPYVDEYIVNIGTPDDDGTIALLEAHFRNNPKVKMFFSEWEGRDQGIKFFTSQTNKAKDACSYDWALYVQADELYLAEDFPKIRQAIETCINYPHILGFTFDFLHFDGDYATVNPSSYAKEVRLVRRDAVNSIHDAVTFGIKAFSNTPLMQMDKMCAPLNVRVFHYGWTRTPEKMKAKLINFDSFYHNDAELKEMHKDFDTKHKNGYDYGKRKDHLAYNGPHPISAHERIRKFEKEHADICRGFIFKHDEKPVNDMFVGDEIVVGNHGDIRGVGDSILITGLIREVNKKWPNKKIVVKTLGPKTFFQNNPRVYRTEEALIPHSIETGGGHYIEQKCRYFGIEGIDVRGEIFLTTDEIKVAEETLKLLSGTKPTIMFCFNSTDPRRNWTKEGWEQVVALLNKKYDVFQIEQNIHYHRSNDNVGMPAIYSAVNGARQELRGEDLRRLAALMSVGKKYLGTNTGFMHMAACFGDDNFVFAHSQHEGKPWWLYPSDNHFWENESIETVIKRISEKWLTI